MRPRKVVLDLTGQAVPDGDVPGRFRRLAVGHVVPEVRVTSRCDGALVYERPEERPAASSARNQRAGRYEPDRRGERNRGRFPTPADKAPPGGEPARSARPDPDDDLFVTPAQLARASRVVEVHWRSPTEDPRTRKRPDCRADGTCPRAASADSIIVRCLRTYWR
ncbi:hypothetical protein [Micromonospora purpureochromogenes]|uniref:Uncharacterized protein n=1 Tax=Micromonospora purpureochromogenes TaxID=47872 RepID=A0ABX2RS38_9ACTN|nr:hypothetical protein [Micromonospora purpureochromogenes]NYF59357.1 hypothetical protein [Micromonospora purpureochromogenes]